MPDLTFWGRVIIAALIAAVLGFVAYEIREAGYTAAQVDDQKLLAGKDKEIADLKAAKLKADKDALVAQHDRDEKVRNTEHQGAQRQADIQAQADKDLANEKASHDQFVADLLAGRIRLRIPGAVNTIAPGQLPGAAAGAVGRDGGGTCELRPETAASLAAITGDANRVALELNKYKKIVLDDRKVCPSLAPAP